jgi:hypothetical protein
MHNIDKQLQTMMGIYAKLPAAPRPFTPQEIAIPIIKSILPIKNKYQVQVRLIALSLGVCRFSLFSILSNYLI